MGPVQHLIRLSDQVSKLLMIFAAVWAMALSMIIVADIVANNVYGEALPGVREIVISSIVMIVYLQLGYAVRSHSMLRSDTFVLAMPAPARKALLSAGYLLGAAFFFMILKGTIAPAVHAWTTAEYWGEGALHMPVWPMRFVIIAGAGLAVINYVVAALIDVFGFDERRSG